MALTIGSLFSGIGGLELGLERAGLGPVVWQVEREPYCRAVLAKHWPDAARYDDVCTVGAHTLAPVDVICGGFPCQDISYAGKGAGLAGARSGLWYEFARVVRELGPRYVVVENVAALLDRGLGDVLGTLADLGYDAEWSCIQAADVGAPHRRDRLFLLAYTNRPRLAIGKLLAGGAGGASGAVARKDARVGRTVAHAARVLGDGRDVHAGRGGEGAHPVPQSGVRGAADGPSAWWAPEPDVGRVAHGVPARVDRLTALGNAVVPQVAEVVGRLIVAREQACGERVA